MRYQRTRNRADYCKKSTFQGCKLFGQHTTGKKYGGRKKGIPNKLTKEFRGILKDLLYWELYYLEDRLDQLDPKQRIELMIKMMPYIFWKIQGRSNKSLCGWSITFWHIDRRPAALKWIQMGSDQYDRRIQSHNR